jgi:hypothetical protein
MDGPTIITWNTANFVTVILMIALGVFLFMFLSKAYRTQIAKQ